MRKPRQRSIVGLVAVKQQRRPAASGLAGHWIPPSPSLQAPAPEPTGRLVRSRGSKCFSEEEEELLVKLHALLGNRWSLIAGRLPGRTGKEVESHWNSTMRRKLKCMGVDPDNHRSVTALLALAPDDGQRRRWRPLDLCEAKCPAKHLSHRLSSNDGIATDDCVSDAGSYFRARQELACGVNLELTLATPGLYFGGKEQVTGH